MDNNNEVSPYNIVESIYWCYENFWNLSLLINLLSLLCKIDVNQISIFDRVW